MEAMTKQVVSSALRHRGAILLAFVAGTLCIAPALYFAYVAPGYSGITMMGSDAEEHYTARVAEIYDGYPGLGNVFLSQKNQPYFIPGLGENIVAGIGKVSGLTPSGAIVFSKFFFPFLIVLLVYALVYGLTASSLGALLAAAFVVFGDAVLGGPASFVGVLTGHAPITDFLLYARPINPEISAIFLFSALFLLSRFFFKDRTPTRMATVVLGFLTGGSLYLSTYVSSFLFVVLGLSTSWFLFRKEYVRAKALVASIVVGFIALAPFLLNLLTLRQSPLFTESSIRLGLIHMHTPIIGFWLTALVISLFVWPKRYLTSRPFFAIGVVALVILLNQQIVTGLALQSAHYHWYLTKPLAGMVLALFAVFLIEWMFKSKILRGIAYSISFSVLLVSAGLVQRASYTAHYAEAVAAQAYAPVFSFLQTMPGQSVWANRTLSLYLPMYTKQDAPNNDYARDYLVPQTFLEDRLLLEYALRKIAPADALVMMQNEREDIAQRLFDVYWRDQHGSYATIPDALLERYVSDYEKTVHQSILAQLSTFGTSVVVWDTEQDPSWDLGHAPGTKPIFSTARFEIYQLATTTSDITLYR